MKLLILGGTSFVGRHLAEVAIGRGHAVALFNRGQTNPDLFPQAEHLHGDRRAGDLTALAHRVYDAVIDTCGYVPRVVRDSAQLLQATTPHYTFISTISIYADFDHTGMTENAPLAALSNPATEEVNGETYGGLKVLCEQEVVAAYPNGALVIRPGLIVGPHDPTHRFGYWPRRFAANDDNGPVLLPDRREMPIQVIDARDLAAWTLDLIEKAHTGIYNAVGPQHPLTFGTLIDTCQQVAGQNAMPVYVDEAFLLEAGLQGWTELPLWMPESQMPGLAQISNAHAMGAGLRFRHLADTVRDTLSYELAQGSDWGAPFGKTLPPARERELLALWRAKK